jgi:hypothetical protein
VKATFGIFVAFTLLLVLSFMLLIKYQQVYGPERNMIVGVAPFYQTEIPYREGSEGEIVATVRAFAREHAMDYLGGPGHPTLDPGEFNLHAAGRRLNLGAVRGIPISPNIQIFAITRGEPTTNDRALTAEFVRELNQP